jgi:hypothetical protein
MTPGRYYPKQSFSGWDKDRIAVACSPYILQDNIDTGDLRYLLPVGSQRRQMAFSF